ncbi:MAG TPA: rhodanese-like domain-containing protein [Gemmatimonadaceae bacterium]|nr:rhodanese-like domain-containing protein [Gemmatimonadaceae bacterium]
MFSVLCIPLFASLAVATPTPGPAIEPTRPASIAAAAETLTVSTTWLAEHLHDPNVVVIEVGMESMGRSSTDHIPGARMVDYHDITTDDGGLNTELPPVQALVDLLTRIGVSTGSRVVLYGAPPPVVTRAFFALDYLGGTRPAILLGGLSKWKSEGRPVVAQLGAASHRGKLVPRPNPSVVVNAGWVRRHLGKPSIALVDTRTPSEYFGGAERHGAVSGGHLPGARKLEWQELFSSGADFDLRSPAELRDIFSRRAHSGDTVITYCAVGYRASATYFVARLLGYPARLYDGSYEGWSQLGYPLTRDTVALLAPR